MFVPVRSQSGVLDGVLDRKSRKVSTVLLRDFSNHIGEKPEGGVWEECSELNLSGVLLLDFCATHGCEVRPKIDCGKSVRSVCFGKRAPDTEHLIVCAV